MSTSVENLVLRLFDIDCIRFGSFKQKSGIISPIYIDLRLLVSYPDIMQEASEHLWRIAKSNPIKFDNICGVPYAALPISAVLSVNHNVPIVIKRKEQKEYGTGKLIEGVFSPGDKSLVFDDVLSSGSSIMETVEGLNSGGLKVTDAILLVDREQGGKENLAPHGITVYSVLTITEMMNILLKRNKIDQETFDHTMQFIAQNKISNFDLLAAKATPLTTTFKCLSYEERCEIVTHPVAKRLLRIMANKKSNLALSADVTTSAEVLKLADDCGPSICALKLHIDILSDFTSDIITRLKGLALKHEFLLFEDRKFADIGHTVGLQYKEGIYRIHDWADMVTVHSISGPGILKALKSDDAERACILVAQLSSEGNLITSEYTNATLKMANEHSDIVMGVVCQSALAQHSKFIRFTPGVHIASETDDGLGQRYRTPETAVSVDFADVLIVGRGIIQSGNPAEAARRYQEAGYQAHSKLVGK